MFFLAALSYGISIFIDVSVYHLKYHIHDIKNLRYLFSLINIFQYFARGCVLIFVPIMAYYTETIRSAIIVWQITVLAHVFVILLLLPLLSRKFSRFFSINIIELLNRIFGKSKKIELSMKPIGDTLNVVKNRMSLSRLFFSFNIFISGTMFSIGITFLYYLSFSYPQKALTLTSIGQVINMFGTLTLILLIDPKIMSSIDKGEGQEEIKILTRNRIFVHICLIALLIFIK